MSRGREPDAVVRVADAADGAPAPGDPEARDAVGTAALTGDGSGREPATTEGRRPRARGVVVGSATAVVTLVVALVALSLGDYPLTLGKVAASFVSDTGFARTIVLEWRLPRVLAAIAFGAALGASGALFQTLTRNPLGSPDVIGFSTGAYTGAIVVITLGAGGVVGTSVGALAGGLATALVVYLLAWRRGVAGFRLIVVGIAVTAVLTSLNNYLLLRAQTEVAMAASIWGAGSLALVGWEQLAVVGPILVVLAFATALVVPPLRQLELGDDAARAHGVPVEPARLAVVVVGVALIAIVTAACGPIAFVALAAPQIAKRLHAGAGIPVAGAAGLGAVLLLVADTLGQHVLPGVTPVGIVTVVLGGVYLIVLLVKEARQRL
ncbi:FecCD family ABC transporter permease [Litorihabitans aurantiacus]|uniref:Iron-enterobactin transporter permease n=1 Tax=Litorihabitans aurantiacus TaxID=1930061 RepID=A0AA38CRS3_9MICO|nr:iron chelate uptake ABC transporter family permease subunit [Litorihabitans aurantiacus]GMA33038.1 iron-enterobactin transporter permease [Litorihabitans aurantiacus]